MSWRTRFHLYLHTQPISLLQQWMHGSAGDGEWLTAVMPGAAVWVSALPAGAQGKKQPVKEHNEETKGPFGGWTPPLGLTQSSSTMQVMPQRKPSWLLLETQPEPLPTHRCNKLKPAKDLPWMCHVAKKCSLWTTTSWCFTNILSVSVLQHWIIPLHIYQWFKNYLLIFTYTKANNPGGISFMVSTHRPHIKGGKNPIACPPSLWASRTLFSEAGIPCEEN